MLFLLFLSLPPRNCKVFWLTSCGSQILCYRICTFALGNNFVSVFLLPFSIPVINAHITFNTLPTFFFQKGKEKMIICNAFKTQFHLFNWNNVPHNYNMFENTQLESFSIPSIFDVSFLNYFSCKTHTGILSSLFNSNTLLHDIPFLKLVWKCQQHK